MIWELIKKDILKRSKNPTGFILLVTLPLIFAILIWLAFAPSDSDSGQTISAIKLIIEDQDDSFASQFLCGAFGRGELENMFDTEVVSKDMGRPIIDRGKASALLIIPAGFGDSLLNQNQVTLSLVKNPSESFKPKIVEETLNIITEGGGRLIRIASDPLQTIKKQMDLDQEFSDARIALISIQINRLIKKGRKYLFPSVIQLQETEYKESKSSDTASSNSTNIFAAVLCGVSAMFILFLLESTARDIFREQENHTMLRIMMSPAGLVKIITSKMLFLLITGMTSHILIWIFAVLFFDVQTSIEMLVPFLMISLATIAGYAGIISMIFSIAQNRNQAMSLAPIFIIGFSMLGGSMISLNQLPDFIQKMAVISPVYWGVDGLKKVILQGASIESISTNLLILGSLTVAFSMLSYILFYRKFRI